MSKSYWGGVSIEGDTSKAAVLSWFPFLADGLTPYKAEIFCDVETDREKKIRLFATDAEGQKYVLVRTKLVGGRASVSRKKIV